MQSQHRFFEDLAKALNGAAGTFSGMAREAQEAARERAREFMGGIDFVSRDEFETLKDRLAKAQDEIDALKAQLAGVAAPKTAAKVRRSSGKGAKL